MNLLPLYLATALYVAQSLQFYLSGNKPMALTFAGYAVANVGLILVAK